MSADLKGTCPARFWAWGHKFEPRYEDVPIPELLPAECMWKFELKVSSGKLSEALCRRAYVRDVCVRCGATVERTGQTAPHSGAGEAVGGPGARDGSPGVGEPAGVQRAPAGLYAGRPP